jgi:short-subunit dehydrogenase
MFEAHAYSVDHDHVAFTGSPVFGPQASLEPAVGAGRGMKVVVTGASSGIGAAAAEAFAAAGHEVALVARRGDRLADVAARCGPSARTWVADLSELDDLQALATTIDGELGGVEVLVNNAGIPKRKRVLTMTGDDLEEALRVNFLSPARLTLAFLPGMVERGTGHVVNVSSMGVHSAAFGIGAYSASKAALELFTEALHMELTNTGVRAHLFVPGTTRSEFSDDKPGNEPSRWRPGLDAATPEEVAAALVACIGDARFRTFAVERDAAICAAKEADPEGFLAGARHRLAALL